MPLSRSPGALSLVAWGDGHIFHHTCHPPASRLMNDSFSPLSTFSYSLEGGEVLVVVLVLLTVSSPGRSVSAGPDVWGPLWNTEHLLFPPLAPSTSAGDRQAPPRLLAALGSGAEA